MTTTAANVHDANVLGQSLQQGDAGLWQSGASRSGGNDPQACSPCQAFHQQTLPPSWRRGRGGAWQNLGKSQIRVKIAHGIGVVERVFGFTKVRYRGLTKNTHHPAAAHRAIVRNTSDPLSCRLV
jgi:IS5 family transposase